MMNNEAYQRALRVIGAATESLHNLAKYSEISWLDAFAHIEKRTGKIVLTGVGKSGYIAMKIAATLTSLGQVATFVHPVEAMHGDTGAVSCDDVVIALSFSGNTKELINFVRHVKKNFKVKVVGMTGGADSLLAQLSDVLIPISILEEGCPLDLAPMASTTTMLVAGDALAAGLTSPQQFTKKDFARFHPSGSLGLSLTLVEQIIVPGASVTVVADTPLQKTIQKMSEVGKGIIAVVSVTGELLGGITDGDIRRFFGTYSTCEGVIASDAMNRNPKCIHMQQTLKEALQAMEYHKITNLFVIDSERIPLGIIHIHDVVDP